MKGYLMNYELKDKINATNELLQELEMKGWQEIEHLQAQIANLAEGSVNDKLRQLLKNLLTSYYVFIGGIEAINGEPIDEVSINITTPIEEPRIQVIDTIPIDDPEALDSTNDFMSETDNSYEVSDPFEYFVDFDEPTGEPLTDEDLYDN